MNFGKWHWRSRNLALRLVGLWMIVVGVVLLAVAVSEALGWLGPEWEAQPGWSAATGIVVGAAGVFLSTRPPYRPDLGDVSWWAGRAGHHSGTPPPDRSRRSWWTGDPLP